MSFSSVFTNTLGVLTIIGQVLIVLLIIAYILRNTLPTKLRSFLENKGLLAAFIVAVIAFLSPLTYSEIIGYDPCKLCWLQRIAMFPQLLLLGIALWRKDYAVKFYSIPMVVIGAGISLYHYLLQNAVISSNAPCSAVGYSVTCTGKYTMTFGYITIPLMAMTAFILILLFLLHSKKSS